MAKAGALLAALVLIAWVSYAQSAPAAEVSEETLPGVELARTLATATGIAITPLFGVGAVGAWQYFTTPAQQRGQLPWFASRWFWIPAVLVVIFLLLKEPILGWVPAAKKPLDALEVVESKVSAVVATPAIVPMFLAAFAGVGAAEAIAALRESPRALEAGVLFLQAPSSPLGWLLTGVAVVLFLAAFFCVWLAFHVINVLILLSPFGPLDMLLRLIKFGVLAVLLGATLVHPYLGVGVASLIVLTSIPLALWSWRLSVFGGTLAFDLVTLRHRRTRPDERGAVAFTAQRIAGLPSRARGRFRCSPETGPRFVYRRALIGPARELELSPDGLTLCRGALLPLVEWTDPANGRATTLFRLAPRYRSHEDALVGMWGLPAVRDGDLRRGFKAAVAWLREMAGRGSDLVGTKIEAWTSAADSGR